MSRLIVISLLLTGSFAYGQPMTMQSGEPAAASLRRLPPPAPLTRLNDEPAAPLTRPPDDNGERDVLLYAGGAVEMRPPLSWKAFDVPHGRELRVAIAPATVGRLRKMPSDGMWAAYHVLDPLTVLDDRQAQAELVKLMPSRLRMATDRRGVWTNGQWIEVDGYPALMQGFFTRREGAGRHEDVESRGWHLLARTLWGVFELHAVADASQFDRLAPAFDSVLASVLLPTPNLDQRPPAPKVQAAAEALGAWKSQRGRMRLRPDGNIEILLDRPGGYAIDGQGRRQWDPRLVTLKGRFEAREDVLFVTFRDGSKLNFRWRLHEGELLLTDHTGQISQLRRLLE